jgi:hypothetical protein
MLLIFLLIATKAAAAVTPYSTITIDPFPKFGAAAIPISYIASKFEEHRI